MRTFMSWSIVILVWGALTSAVAPEHAFAQPEAPGEPRTEQEQARRARNYATVGDVHITVGDIEDQIADQTPFMRERLADPSKLQEFAEGLLRAELMAREAERRGYDTNAGVQQTTEQSLVQNLIRMEFDERITRESITAAQVQAYYDAHIEEFSRPAMARAAHILLNTREEADALLEQARAADARGFRELVRIHSVDTETNRRGGDLRYFMRDGRSPSAQSQRQREEGPGAREPDAPVTEEIVVAAFAIETLGDVSDPIVVGERFSLVKLTGRRIQEVRPVAQAAESIRLRLWRETRQEAINTFVSGLREGTTVEIHDRLMRSIHLDPIAGVPALPPVSGMNSQPVETAPASVMSPSE